MVHTSPMLHFLLAAGELLQFLGDFVSEIHLKTAFITTLFILSLVAKFPIKSCDLIQENFVATTPPKEEGVRKPLNEGQRLQQRTRKAITEAYKVFAPLVVSIINCQQTQRDKIDKIWKLIENLPKVAKDDLCKKGYM